MLDQINLFKTQFNELAIQKKLAIIGGIVGIISGMIVITMFATTPSFQVLYSNITPQNAGLIVQRLNEQGVKYKLSGGGTTIFVPQEKVYDLRIAFATEGLPEGNGVGFELFDESKLGVTEFIQQINYQRALTGELTRTIKQFPEVENVRIHITVPKESLFIEDQKVATASVILKIKPGIKLKPKQVDGVVHLVSSAVIGLHAEDVTVVDTHGVILAGGKEADEGSRLVNTQMELKKNYEKREQDRVTSMLERIVGPGKAVVRLNAEMNFQKQEISEELYDPNTQVARSESTTEDTSKGAVEVKGVPGVVTNVAGAANQTGGANTQTATTNQAGVALGGNNQDVNLVKTDPAQSNSSTSVTNFEISKTVKRTTKPMGTVQKLSVAVLVDGKYEMQGTGDAAKEVYVPRSQGDLDKIKEIVSKALGVNTQRGDTIEVANVPFDTSHLEKEISDMESFQSKEFWIANGQYAITALIIIILFLFVLKPLLKWVTGPVTIEEEEPHKTVAELEMEDKELEESMTVQEHVDYRGLAAELTKEDPERVAEFIRKWVREKPDL
ncbi:MAG: flagellar M-ring protein FliF [Nitrospinae bacterium]|nr:flagellar M-ring protein FliF [Nitrospinota bacterium]